jgi:Flp pilus assembly protein TadG
MEFAFALPIFLVVFFGIVEFGVILTDQIQLANSAREATRAGSIHFESAPVPIPDSDRISQATAAAQSSASSLISCPLQPPTVTPKTTSNPELITVAVECLYTPVTPLGSLVTFFGKALNLPATLGSSSTRYVEP